MSGCARIRPLIVRSVDGDLDPGEALRLAGHLTNCTVCRIVLARESRLAEMLDDPDPRVRIRAAEVLLDRGYGKPTQQIDANVAQTIDTGRAHIEALLRLAREAKEPKKLVVEHPPALPAPDE